MIIVTYNTETKEIISVVPISLVTEERMDIEMEELDGIVAAGYDYIIYNGTEPLFEDRNGKVYLKENELLLPADYLEN